jgi:hypothetical protein
MVLHALKPFTSLTTQPAVFKLPAFAIRGGEAAPAGTFDMGLAKTRLEGLAYSTVTTLMLNAALRLFSSTPKKLESIPDDPDKAKVVKLNNSLKVAFGISLSFSAALGLYTTIVFTLMAIYSKTALGMGLQEEYLEFFDKCAPFRLAGFRAFIGTLMTYNVSWVLSLVLNYEGDIRWWLALPAVMIGVTGLLHVNSIMGLASSIIYS